EGPRRAGATTSRDRRMCSPAFSIRSSCSLAGLTLELRAMVRRLLILLALSFPLCLAATAQAAQSDISRYVLPPGNYGGIPTNTHSLDQLPLYSGLTPLRRNV